MSLKESLALFFDVLSEIREDHGLLNALWGAPLVFLIMAWMPKGDLPPDDEEKIQAAKERSAKIDDWSELVSE